MAEKPVERGRSRGQRPSLMCVAGEHTLQLCVPAMSGEGKKDEGENV